MKFIILCILTLTLALISGNCENLELNEIEKFHDLNRWSIWDTLKMILKLVKLSKFDPNYLGLDPYEETLKFGYPAENHIVQTDDGYLLTVLRIPHGIKNSHTSINRPIVYLQPGLFCSAACFTDFGPNRALAYFLADSGYDVWMAHPRGTTFSRNHTIYNSMKDKEYWNFSWHEIGTVDAPNTIDYILEVTKQKQINYIGHSQGTTILFVMLSEKPEYNSKINVALALAPIAFLENFASGTLKKLAGMYIYIKVLNVYDVFPHTKPLAELIMDKCNYNSSVEDLAECSKWLDFAVGYHQDQIDPRNIALIATHFPGGASTKQLEHYAQLINNGGFTKFDYGNKVICHGTPTSYNLKNINCMVYLFYSENDILSTTKDVQKLHKCLQTSKLIRVNFSPFSHFDYLLAKVAPDVLYPEIVEILNTYI